MRALRHWAAIAALALSGAAAQADMFKPSRGEQIKLGERAATDLRKEENVLPETDPRVTYLRALGTKLAGLLPQDKKDPWKWSFDVIDSKEINAFALPGGPVFFYTGLLAKLNTEDELAGVLAHEMTHVQNQHWASAYADNQKRRLGITLLLLLTRANSTAFNIADVADDVLFSLPYSRKHETEADMRGLELMVKAGFNPKGMADTFRMLGSVGGSKPPEFLSTHPDDKNRVQRIEDAAKAMNRSFPAMKPLPEVFKKAPAEPKKKPKKDGSGGSGDGDGGGGSGFLMMTPLYTTRFGLLSIA